MDKDLIESGNTSPTESTNPTKRRKIQDDLSQRPLCCICQKFETSSTRLVVAVEKIMATLISRLTATSVIGLAVTKLGENHKGITGSSTGDILAG